VNRTAVKYGIFNLTIATGDLHNNMALSAILSPSSTHPGSRNLVVNLWDWNVGASWNDGATWTGWADGEASPGYCGEGGGGTGLGASGYAVMEHRSWITVSSDGGHNWVRHNLPGGGGFNDYVRKAGSRSEPSGTWFGLMSAPAPTADGAAADGAAADGAAADVEDDEDDDDDDDGDGDKAARLSRTYSPNAKEGDEVEDDDEEAEEMDPSRVGYTYSPGLRRPPSNGNVIYLLKTEDFGQNWTWTPLPKELQAASLTVDPTDAHSLFALMPDCLAHSTDDGVSWSKCSDATGLRGRFTRLLVKDSATMFMIRSGAVPLRTKDGGRTWTELSTAAPLFKYGATFDASLSWSGRTLVLAGVDLSAIGRGAYGTAVWKSHNDGDDWIDETGDLVTISPGPGVWYEKDFYFVTRGEGVAVKRNFEP